MKTITGIILIFSVGAQVVTEAALNPINDVLARRKRASGFTISKSDLPKINSLRKEFAEKSGIPTADLSWDTQLVEKAEQVTQNCSDEKQGSDYRYFRVGADENGQRVDSLIYAIITLTGIQQHLPYFTEEHGKVVNEMQKNIKGKQSELSLRMFELFNPAQTKIGCAPNPCQGLIEPRLFLVLESAVRPWSGHMYSYSHVCALGTSGKIQDDTVQLVSDNRLELTGMQTSLSGTNVEVKPAAGSNAQQSDKSSSGNAQPVKSSFDSNFIGVLLVSVSIEMINMIF